MKTEKFKRRHIPKKILNGIKKDLHPSVSELKRGNYFIVERYERQPNSYIAERFTRVGEIIRIFYADDLKQFEIKWEHKDVTDVLNELDLSSHFTYNRAKLFKNKKALLAWRLKGS